MICKEEVKLLIVFLTTTKLFLPVWILTQATKSATNTTTVWVFMLNDILRCTALINGRLQGPDLASGKGGGTAGYGSYGGYSTHKEGVSPPFARAGYFMWLHIRHSVKIRIFLQITLVLIRCFERRRYFARTAWVTTGEAMDDSLYTRCVIYPTGVMKIYSPRKYGHPGVPMILGIPSWL